MLDTVILWDLCIGMRLQGQLTPNPHHCHIQTVGEHFLILNEAQWYGFDMQIKPLMSPPSTTSTLLRSKVGPLADDLIENLVQITREVHEASQDAKEAGGLMTNHAYGNNVAQLFPLRVSEWMSSIPESKTRGSTGFTFEFTVFEGTLFLPITGKPTRSGLPAIKAGRRSFKRLAFSVPTGKVGNSQMALDLDGIDAESSTHTPFFCDIEDVVVIAASFQSEVGPMGLFIGQITLAEGRPVWSKIEPIDMDRFLNRSPFLAPAPDSDSADAKPGDLPFPKLRPRKSKSKTENTSEDD